MRWRIRRRQTILTRWREYGPEASLTRSFLNSLSSILAIFVVGNGLIGLYAAYHFQSVAPIKDALTLIIIGLAQRFIIWKVFSFKQRAKIVAEQLARSGIVEIDRMDGVGFERYLEVLFRKLGYSVERTRATGDFGADLIIEKDQVRTVVQAKRYNGNVGVKAIQEVVGARSMYRASRSMVVTNARYTTQAIQLAHANEVVLWDRDRLVNAISSIQKPSEGSKQAVKAPDKPHDHLPKTTIF